MKTNKSILWLLSLMLCATPVLTACSDDDDNKNGNPTQEETAKYDDLAYFQNAICRIDSLGNLARYNVGEALYEAEPQHLYIGVDDIEEAANWFSYWIAPDVELGNITPTTTDLTAQLTDTLGRAQGTIYFKAGSGQSVAEVTYSPDTQLKYIDRITFLLNSAWPFNSGGNQWKKGDIKTFRITGAAGEKLKSNDKYLNFVLIREGGNGVKPMWCAITNEKYSLDVNVEYEEHSSFLQIKGSQYCPAESTARTISDILRSDWSFFASKFDEAGCGKLDYSESYWIDKTHTYFFLYYDMIMYGSPDYYIHGAKWPGTSKQPFLLKIDWFDDGDRTFTVTESGSYYEPGHGPENLFDGSCESSWASYQTDWARNGSEEVSGEKCCWFEFQSETSMKPKSYTLWTTNTSGEGWQYSARLPAAWRLYGKKSSRGKWVELHYQPWIELPYRNSASQTFEISNPQECQFFRFEVYWNRDGHATSLVELGQLVLNE